ncbi:MAG TPA: hypothetical protein VF493_00735, partial [Terriglobales bacterium]
LVAQLVTLAVRTIARWFWRIALGGVSAVLLLMIAIWVEHLLPIELPRPTGKLPVGRTSRAVSADLTAWIWYPANHREHVAPYLPDSVRERWTHSRPGVVNVLTRDLERVRAHGVFEAPFHPDTTRTSVVLFRGGGGGGVLSYTTLFEELASHGYVVVAIEGGLGGNPELCDGRPDQADCATKLINNGIAAMRAVIDRLATISSNDSLFRGHLDMTRLGVFGHSFGGAQALAFCAADRRCAAGANIDGQLFGSTVNTAVTVPFLWLLSDHGSARDPVSRRIEVQIQSVYERQPADTRARIMIRGANHFTFNEDGALLKSGAIRGIMRLVGVLGISGRRQVEITAYAVRAFFDSSLRHTGDAQVAIASTAYQEIVRLP